jgi:peptide/nickel transport system substrate-binding protein
LTFPEKIEKYWSWYFFSVCVHLQQRVFFTGTILILFTTFGVTIMDQKNFFNLEHEMKNALSSRKISRRDLLRRAVGLAIASAVVPAAGNRAGAAVTGKRIPELEMLAPDWPAAHEALNRIITHWKELGLQIRPSFEKFDKAFPRILTHHFGHGACMIWAGGEERLDPGFFLREFYHSSRAIEGFWNYGRFIDKAIDEKIESQDREMELARRVEKLIDLQERLAEEHAIFCLMHPPIWQAFNIRDWGGYIPAIGTGHMNIWTYLRLKSNTGRDTFRLVLNLPVKDLNPLVATNHKGCSAYRLVYDTFARWGPDGRVRPWAAKAWKVVTDDTVDLQIRPGMLFHDGRPVTVEDARFSLEIFKKSQWVAFPSDAGEIERVDLVGEDTVRVRLKDPCASFLTVGLCTLMLLPSRIWKEVKNPQDLKIDAMVGSGPFRLKSGAPDGEIVLEAHKGHWAAPIIHRIRLLTPRALDESVEMLRRDEVDALEAHLSPDAVNELASVPHLAVREAPGNGVLEVRFDVSSPPFNDKAFRAALNHAIPREDINRAAFRGSATLAHNSVITPRLEQWGSGRIPAVSFDVQKARNILKEAGYGWELGGRLCCPPKGWKAKEGSGDAR